MSGERVTSTAGFTKLGHPSVWLVVPTLSLLAGQAVALLPLVIPSQLFLLALAPLLLVIRPTTRRWGIFIVVGTLSFWLGWIRRWQLLSPDLPASHVRSLLHDDPRLYLPGALFRGPELLPNRRPWRLRCEQIWRPT